MFSLCHVILKKVAGARWSLESARQVREESEMDARSRPLFADMPPYRQSSLLAPQREPNDHCSGDQDDAERY